MASTLAAARLTEAHRLAQARVGVQTVQDMFAAWSLLDPKALDATMPDWLRVSLSLIQNRRRTSAVLAADYLRSFRLLELGDVAGFAPVLMGAADTAAVTTSLTVTGPVALKSAMTAGTNLGLATDTARANSARAASRHTLGGGRDTISATTEADRYAIGYQRVGSGDTCKWCEMLIGRGAVYSGPTAQFDAHDGCNCSAEPVYSSPA